MNPNDTGLIYYGTDYQYILDLDKMGLQSPRHRNEQYISVSISGYESKNKCEHPELQEFARIFSEELKIAEYKDCFLNYKSGYVNSITCVEGFGPNPNLFYNSFFGLVENLSNNNLVTVVLSSEASNYLVFPDKEREFEYLSLALHCFIKEIIPDLIIGWIVSNDNVQDLKQKMDLGVIEKREIWSIKEFQTFDFDYEHCSRYGFFPHDINMYLDNVSPGNKYSKSSKNHLKNILQEVIQSEKIWNEQDNTIQDYLKRWMVGNQDKVMWNSMKWRYEWR